MIKKIVLGGLLGGVAMFVWGAVSWTVLTWHDDSMQRFSNEQVVARDLDWYAPSSGIYILPNPNKFADELNEEQQQAATQDALARMKAGPFIFVSINKAGADAEDPRQFIYALLVNIAVAAVISWMILVMDFPGYLQRLTMIVGIGFVVAVMASFPHWNWWKFSDIFAITSFLDMWATFAVAAVMIALVSKR
jgi:hypothetical protein